MVWNQEDSREKASALVRGCFHDLIKLSEDGGGFVSQTSRPDLERAEQRGLSQERIEALREQISTKQFGGLPKSIGNNRTGLVTVYAPGP